MLKCTLLFVFQVSFCMSTLFAQQEKLSEPWIWTSEPPEDCPFERSTEIVGVALTKNYRHYELKSGGSIADTWYPTWAANDTLYSPWTDGRCPRLDGSYDQSQSGHIAYNKEIVYNSSGKLPLQATTGQAAMVGDNPLDMHIYSLGTYSGDPAPADAQDRLVLSMVNEAVACLADGVVSDADLLDAGVIFGTGFAPFRGGPINYARERGLGEVITKLRALSAGHGHRFEPHSGWSDLTGDD